MRRLAFVLGFVACFACEGDGIRYRGPSSPDGSTEHEGGAVGLDGGVPRPDAGFDASITPGGDGGTGPTDKSASVTTVPPGYTVADEPYKYSPKSNASGTAEVKVNGPDGMTSDGVSVAWEPTKGQAGTHKVAVETTTVDGKAAQQEYTVTVAVSEKKASGDVDKSGGQVTVTAPSTKSRGAGVSVPSGGVDGSTTVTVAEVDKAPPKPNAPGANVAVDFGPRGTVFTRPATITLPLPADIELSRARLSAHVYNARGRWERVKVVGVDLANRLLLARASHFSVYMASQAGFDFDVSLERMNERAFCPGNVVGRAVVDARLRDLDATSIQNLTPDLIDLAEAGELSVQGLVSSPGLRGSLRAITVYEVVDGDGASVARRALATTLFLPGDGSARVTHTDALGNVLAVVTFPTITDSASLSELSARLRGAASVAHFGDLGTTSAALGASLYFVYGGEDLSLEPIDAEYLGVAAVELPPGEAVELPVAEDPSDVDCDGLAGEFDGIDDRAIPAIVGTPSELVSTVVGESVVLRAELLRANGAAALSWEVLEQAPAQLDPTDDPTERSFTAQAPGRYFVRAFGDASGVTLEARFVLDVAPRPEAPELPECVPVVDTSALKVGESLAVRAVFGDGNVPPEALTVEWGLVFPGGDTDLVVGDPQLSSLDREALFTPLATGSYGLGCRTRLGDLTSPTGVVGVAALSPDQNLAPVDTALLPPAAAIGVGETLHLSAFGVDPEAGEMLFEWSSDGGELSGEGAQPGGEGIDFTSASAGVFTVSVRIGDGVAPPTELQATIVVSDGALGDVDADSDGWPAGTGPVGDCNDQDANVHPTAIDTCGDAVDDDCDGVARVDDCDGDGVSTSQGDCADDDPRILPGAPELCDGTDNDCDDATDEDFAVVDRCEVGVGQCAAPGAGSCSLDGLYAVCVGEPGPPSVEVCDQVDNDCDGEVDEDGVCPDCVPTSTIDESCDGVDDDCDGTADDDYVAAQTNCGEGACASQGVTSCVSGVERDSCAPTTGATVDPTCDGVDDDCDGTTDEEYVAVDTTCGAGACASTGVTSCVDGVVQDSCVAAQAADSDTTCDGVDDDCDGDVDEEFVSETVSCGVGGCAATGRSLCVQGAVVNDCTAGVPASADTLCDGVDEDCDGQVDEDFESQSTQCGVGACFARGRSLCLDGVEETGCFPGQPAASDTTCDAQDDDCDGQTDEDFVSTGTTCGQGACAAEGATACDNGVVIDTCAASHPGDSDTSCNGVDEDCNGVADDGFVPQGTTCGVGACAARGVTTCEGGAIADTCSAGQPASADTTCDGVDDDCDGTADEEYAPVGTTCGVGACAAEGVTSCVAGNVLDGCTAGTPAGSDLCDGLDNDCDGEADEDHEFVPTECGLGVCARTGVIACLEGVATDTCTVGLPLSDVDDSCDARDSDCDGAVDEDYVAQDTQCGIGACRAGGATTCVDGVESDTCVAAAPAENDVTCDGVDDDCDDDVDEDFVSFETSCGLGACAAGGVATCEGGELVDSCAPGTPAASDACDGLDNDCDGELDEDHLNAPTQCGVGACAAQGVAACQNGEVVDTCAAGTPAASDATCDGIDEDCSGEADEDYIISQTVCGVGACGNEGLLRCLGGVEQDSCEPLTGASSDTTCDNFDDDCDGQVDEDFPAEFATCGIGACLRNGPLACQDGEVISLCEPGTPAASDPCDGIDNDCDGEVDEDFVSIETTCGVGVCGGTGTTVCGGTEGILDTCFAGEPTSTVDDACNGVDDDCDGAVDEEYLPTSTTCGVGACAGSGQLLCVQGSLEDTCVANEGLAQDASCDGVDDDCDGLTDEDYVATATECGVGACQAVGTLTCFDGVESDTCVQGLAAESDFLCNAIDDDCDGETDEDYVATETSCGVGACEATGVIACVDGSEQDTCVVGLPLGEFDTTCDGVDDDCDEIADDDYEGSTCTAEGAVGQCAESVSACDGGTEFCLPGLPGVEVCNGLDDDCNETIDDIAEEACETASPGLCAFGHVSCSQGEAVCAPNEGPLPEICNAIDDDCNGEIDDLGEQACETGLPGACGPGVLVCSEGSPLCSPITRGSPESCNGVDDDCNGEVDDLKGERCETGLPGLCGLGSIGCSGSETACIPDGPFVEICNDLDDNCDGQVDEDGVCNCQPASEICDGLDNDCNEAIDDVQGECNTGLFGLCEIGHFECDPDFSVICVPDGKPLPEFGEACSNQQDDDCDGLLDSEDPDCSCEPSPESCNGLDDDCNGAIDDIPSDRCETGLPGLCGTGSIACSGGEPTCVPDKPLLEICNDIDDDCDGQTDEDGVCDCVPSTEVCDGLDNDCNGAFDDVSGNCETGLPGVCQLGHFACDRDLSLVCQPNVGPFLENDQKTCTNNVDDDCDGLPDLEDPDCSCQPVPEICNGLDDDCDGVPDNGLECPLDGEVCETASRVGEGLIHVSLAGYKDDTLSSCAPGDVERWFQIEVPQPDMALALSFTGLKPPRAYSVRLGSQCSALEPVFCGLTPPPTVPQGPVFFVVEGPPEADFDMQVTLIPLR